MRQKYFFDFFSYLVLGCFDPTPAVPEISMTTKILVGTEIVIK